MVHRAIVLNIRAGEIDPMGLPEPLGLFLDPKTANKEEKIAKKKKKCPLDPLLGGSPSEQVTLVGPARTRPADNAGTRRLCKGCMLD